MQWRIPLIIVVAVFTVASCDQQPLQPQTDSASAAPLFAPAAGNGGKEVWGPWSDDFPAAVDCGAGVVLDLNDSGWAQVLWKKVDSKQLGHIVWHITLTYTNSATGRSFKVHDVGPDAWHFDADGSLIHTITGRSVTGSGIIGHVVQYDGGSIISVAGRAAGDPDALACAKLR